MVNTNISALNGRNGFIIPGIDESALLGDAVSTAGDINGDGFTDIIIGARNTEVNNQNNAGKVYVVFGSDNFEPDGINLSELDGNNGFTIEGLNSGDFLGTALSNLGDINNDGRDDIIIGANGSNNNAGTSYIIFGQDNFDPTIDLANLNSSNGFTIRGLNSADFFGTSVGSAGDINDDGIPDLIVSAVEADTNGNQNTGASYVIFGNDNGFDADFDLTSLDGSNGFAINGINANNFIGDSVSSAGDVNGDGIDDLIIGAPSAEQAYIVFGSEVNFTPSVNLSELNGINGFVLNGIDSGDGTGVSVANAGDINSDGIDDVIIGASSADVGDRLFAGQAYVVFGDNTGFDSVLELSELNGDNGFTVNGIATSDFFGTSVDGAGDVNRDGISDLVIGARGVNEGAGASYVIFGRENDNEFPAVLEVADLTNREGFTISTNNPDVFLGEAVSGAGDVNRDGIDDLIVGAPLSEPDGNDDAGAGYVIFGRVTNPGDTNDDGAYTNEDVSAISRLAAGLDTELPAYPGIDPVLVADVNGDGVISAFDASIVSNVINGIESPFLSEIPA